MKSYLRVAILSGIALFVLFVDFFTKAYALYVMPHFASTPFYPYGGVGVFQDLLGVDFCLQLTFNQGAAWGLWQNFQHPLMVLRILIIAALLLYMFCFNQKRSYDFGLMLICTGAIGNVVDFFLYGSVVDFFHFVFWGYHFPIFNVADSVITIGGALLLLSPLWSSQKAACHDSS